MASARGERFVDEKSAQHQLATMATTSTKFMLLRAGQRVDGTQDIAAAEIGSLRPPWPYGIHGDTEGAAIGLGTYDFCTYLARSRAEVTGRRLIRPSLGRYAMDN